MTIIYFLILLSVIIVVHELGHLIVAKLFNVYCYEFSLGMGPEIYSKQAKETRYSIRALPIGGYVAMAGENDGISEQFEDIVVPEERTITGLAPWKKICVMSAGIVMNFILAWALMSVFFTVRGIYIDSPKPIVSAVVEGGAAQAAGFMENDEIIKVVFDDGTIVKPKKFDDITMFSYGYDGNIEFTVKRNDETVTLNCTPILNEEDGLYYIGLMSKPGEVHNVNPINALYYGGAYLVDMTKQMFVSLIRVFRGIGLNQLSGPVGIYSTTEQYVSLGFDYYLMLIAILSVNIGIVNALPLPVLDGGRVVITLFESLLHKKLNKKVEMGLMLACWVLLISIMLFATWNDILRMFVR